MKLKLLSIVFFLISSTILSQIVTIPDQEFKSALLNYSPSIDTNNDNQIQVSEALAITTLNISNHQGWEDAGGCIDPPDCTMGGPGAIYYGIRDLTGIEAFVNLTTLNCSTNDLTSLDVSSLTQLTYLDCSNNQNYTITSEYFPGISSLILPISNTLSTLICSTNNFSTLDISNQPSLITLNTSYNQQLANLDFTNKPLLEDVNCSYNKLTAIDLSSSSNLKTLNCSRNLITALTIPSTNQLTSLNFEYNQISGIFDISSCNTLISLQCNNNSLTDITLPNTTTLTTLQCASNQITNLNLINNTGLVNLSCNNNQISNIDIQQNINLKTVNVSSNLITALDLSYQPNLNTIYCQYNQLTSLNLKNGNNSAIIGSRFNSKVNPNLQLICVDNVSYAASTFTNKDGASSFADICSFIPANSNTITGRVSFDFDANGCDSSDTGSVNTKLNTIGTNTSNTTFTNSNGEFTMYTLEAAMNTEIFTNLPSFFSVTPTTQTTNFTGSGNTEVIDFCITANTQVNDVEVHAYTTSESRPGFDTTLRIFYKNNGSTIIPSGTVTLNFNENQEVFNNASVTPDTILPNITTPNSLTWNYTNLLPFEENYIDVNFTINTPTGTSPNPVDGGDTISYTTNITPLTGDATATDNMHVFSDIVVNAYDPNDIICFEGDRINTLQVPEDLTYRVRFQNTGTASAINIVVKETLDTDLDVSTLQPISASHNYRIALNNTNELEFIFENIHLADSTSNEPDSHGWIFYKIKPKSTAVIGDAFDATANIYFDYNVPVITNTAITTVSTTTNIPDANFEQALIDLGYDTGVIDGLVFTDDINTITTLDVSNKNITDLTGIEGFTALTELNCGLNQLTTLNINSNTSLVKLFCNNNQITTLDVTQNVLLENLLFQSNSISTINLNQNTSLKYFNAANNNLTELNLITNTALINLSCNNNAITELNINANTNLTLVSIANNQLTSLKIKNGNNTSISTANFDVTNNTGLTCIEVDDASYSNTTWTSKDTTARYSENCGVKPITITADAISKIYGETDPTLTYTITSGVLIDGDVLAGSLTRVAGENIGTYTITSTLTNANNYTITFVSDDVTIAASPITITADAISKVYGETDPALTYTITTGSLLTSDILTGSLTRVTGEDVGTYGITSTLSNANYTITFVSDDVTIAASPITITADAISKVYGETDPTLTYTITTGSLLTGNILAGSLTRTSGENVGTYSITSTLTNSNYNITFVSDDVTITTTPITVTADAKSKIYGETDPALTYQVTTGTLISGDVFTGSLTRTSGEDVGTYSITSTLTNSNYNITFVSDDVTITTNPITLTADAVSKVYGETDPALTYQVTTGTLISGDVFTGSLTRTSGENVGTYSITSTLTNSNYNITFVSEEFTITAVLNIDKDLEKLKFELYPNPTNGTINIITLEKAELLIYSLIGKELKKLSLNTGNNEITNLNLAKGIYLFKLVSKEKSSTKKVIVN